MQLTVGRPWPLGTATAWACRSLGCLCTPLRTAQQCGSNQREHKSCRRSKPPSAARTIVAVRQPTVGIEAAERGEEPRRGAEVPLAQHRRGIVDALQHLRERRFVAWQAVQRAAAKVLGDTRAQAKPPRLRPRNTGQRVTYNQALARGGAPRTNRAAREGVQMLAPACMSVNRMPWDARRFMLGVCLAAGQLAFTAATTSQSQGSMRVLWPMLQHACGSIRHATYDRRSPNRPQTSALCNPSG